MLESLSAIRRHIDLFSIYQQFPTYERKDPILKLLMYQSGDNHPFAHGTSRHKQIDLLNTQYFSIVSFERKYPSLDSFFLQIGVKVEMVLKRLIHPFAHAEWHIAP